MNDSPKPAGKLMLVLAWVALAALLYLYFDNKIERQYNPNQQPQFSQQTLTLKQNARGHYVTSATINGEPVTLLLDTGATQISVPAHLAQQLQLQAGAASMVSTANGLVQVRQTRIDTLSIGGLTMYDLAAHLNPGLTGDTILLGMNALKDLELVQRGNTLTLRKY
ncbi:retropepsin-like aspartic protease family protein [Ferrimonas senticii]|uniref:retropepsin-like aspartic protease family protein n=1 Tax=Ferrimonas senticii TaxID=394566 RepID=UPI00048651CA|nr:retropepsin-like aspartic protease [Ferrimonas senticii]